MAITAVDRLERESARHTIDEARQILGLTYAEIASALGVTGRMLLRYRKEKNTPSRKVLLQLDHLRHIIYLLGEVFRDREEGLGWLFSPVNSLQGRRGIDLIRKGELDEVVSVLAALYSGAFL
jgi:transcriptional regulator with XRE-family HTH domain